MRRYENAVANGKPAGAVHVETARADRNVIIGDVVGGAADVEAEPEPETIDECALVGAGSAEDGAVRPSPTPRRTMPLALMVMELEISYSPAVSSTAPRKPFVSSGRVFTVVDRGLDARTVVAADRREGNSHRHVGNGNRAALVANARVVQDAIAERVGLLQQPPARSRIRPNA